MAEFDKEKREEKLANIRSREEEDLARILSKRYKIPYLDLTRVSIDLDALKKIPEEKSRAAGVAIVQATGRKLQVAVKNPNIASVREIIEELHREGYEPQLFLASIQSLERAWVRYKEIAKESIQTGDIIDIYKDDVRDFRNKLKNSKDFQKELSTKIAQGASRRATDLLDLVLAGAYELEASDIHIEPEETLAKFRLRLDGILHNILDLTHEAHRILLSRIKLTSGLKLNIHKRAQDGRFTIRNNDVDIEIRVSTLPGPYGESIVMRLLHPNAISTTFDELGMLKPVREMIEKEIHRPNGMVITTGPTGSGKTTTLYAFLKKLRSSEIKIITIEDPIEYHLQGITQTQVSHSAEYTFETGLSAIVRQDPDIILVGEIRNKETAEIAMHASLTGHLVFSTLHTNNAPGTIPRLVDLGVQPNIIAPAINVAIAQRLVRKLCAHCRQETRVTEEEEQIIIKAVEALPKTYKKPDLTNIKTFGSNACDKCNYTGYKGRIGVFEAFLIDDEIEQLILKNPSEAAVREAAVRKGMASMLQDGILKLLLGLTTFSELKRTVGI
ncbi:MAG: type II/IV secretion system protein [bacterium]|nr:type II/IV secretion system protein [bacterium]